MSRGRPIGMGSDVHTGVRRTVIPSSQSRYTDQVLVDYPTVDRTLVPLYITGITLSDPVCLTTSSAHGLSVGDEITIVDGGGVVELEGDNYFVTVQNDTEICLYQNRLLTNSVDGTAFTAYEKDGFFTLGGTGLSVDGGVQSAVLLASDLSGELTQPDTYFGFDMASAGDYLIIGSPGEYKAYIRNLSTGAVVELDGDTFAGTTAGNSVVPRRFGHSVATDGTLFAVAGRSTDQGNNCVHIFDAAGNQLAQLLDDINPQNDGFGVGTFFTENYIIVSAPLKAGTGPDYPGIVWAYRKSDYVRFASFTGTRSDAAFAARAVYAPKDYVFIASSTGDTSGVPQGYLCKVTASGFEYELPFYARDYQGGSYSFQTLNQASSDDLALIFSDVTMTANHLIFGMPGYDGGSLISPDTPDGAIGIWKYAVPDDNQLGLIDQFSGSAIRDPANSARITATGLGDLLFPPGSSGGDSLYFRVVRGDAGVDIIGRFQYVNSNSINGIGTGSMGDAGVSYDWTITPIFEPRNLFTGTTAYQGTPSNIGAYFGHNVAYDSDTGDIFVTSPFENFDGEALPSGAVYRLAWGKDNVDSDWQNTVNSLTVSGFFKGTNPEGYVWSSLDGETLGAANISDTVSAGSSSATTTVGFNLMNVITYSAANSAIHKPNMMVMGKEGSLIISAPNSAVDSDGTFVLNSGRVYVKPTITAI